jgi:putative cardiolipin synthase
MISVFLGWMTGLALLLYSASTVVLRSSARFLERARGPVELKLPRGDVATPLDTLLDPLEAANPGLDGIANVLENTDAFAVRTLTATEAGRSLDLIYYIWSTDLTGWQLLADIMAAADRGVRVRLLLDDVNVQGFDLAFLAMNQHPNVQVRLFNPIRNRGHWVRRGMEFVLGLSRFNRRIHGKVWIADGRVAILGGRNVGDTYFGATAAGARNAHDADVILIGPKVAEVEDVFDSYWNLGLSLPILTLWPRFKINMRRFRKKLARRSANTKARRYRIEALAGRDAAQMLTERLRWTDNVEVLADPPEKALGQRVGPWLSDTLTEAIAAAQHEVRLITPYFVPGAEGLAVLADLAKRGVQVRLLTNSLASTDLFAVHGAYSTYRAPLLAAGAQLYEYAPPRNGTSKRDLLHTKIFLFDGKTAIVGSHNFDLRSWNINIELGLRFDQPEMVAELMAMFDRDIAPHSAYSVTQQGRRLVWTSERGGKTVEDWSEPEAGTTRLLTAFLIGKLPLHRHF